MFIEETLSAFELYFFILLWLAIIYYVFWWLKHLPNLEHAKKKTQAIRWNGYKNENFFEKKVQRKDGLLEQDFHDH